jgi:hypothetical protein
MFQQPQNLFANIFLNVMWNEKFFIYYFKQLDCTYRFLLCSSHFCLGYLHFNGL